MQKFTLDLQLHNESIRLSALSNRYHSLNDQQKQDVIIVCEVDISAENASVRFSRLLRRYESEFGTWQQKIGDDLMKASKDRRFTLAQWYADNDKESLPAELLAQLNEVNQELDKMLELSTGRKIIEPVYL